MMCFETNRPEVLDPAVQSRITQSVEFRPPQFPQIREMLRQYLDLYIIHHSPRSPRLSFPPSLCLSFLQSDERKRERERLREEKC